jgi:hypothetical protein
VTPFILRNTASYFRDEVSVPWERLKQRIASYRSVAVDRGDGTETTATATILLTGSTGFFGAFLLGMLVESFLVYDVCSCV